MALLLAALLPRRPMVLLLPLLLPARRPPPATARLLPILLPLLQHKRTILLLIGASLSPTQT